MASSVSTSRRPHARRWLIITDLVPHSVVFFHYRNDKRAPGRSWRIRDYSSGREVVYGPERWPHDHQRILAMATPDLEAPVIVVEDDYWVDETRRLNRVHSDLLGS